MRAIWVIYKKEMKEYFFTSIAYVILIVFTIASAIFFYWDFILAGYPELTGTIVNLSVAILLLIPLLTARLLAEEKRQGTYELLLTSPATPGQIVFGKFLSAITIISIGVVFTFIYLAIIAQYSQINWGVVISSYLGFLLLASTYISIGMLASAVTDNQVVAGVLAFIISLALYLIDTIKTSGILEQIVREISIMSHFSNFLLGTIYIKDIAFFLLLIFLILFTTSKIVESRTWR